MSAGPGALALERQPLPVGERPAALSRSRSRWDWGLAAATSAAIAGFAWILSTQLRLMNNLSVPAWDLAYDHNVIWNTAQGRLFETSFTNRNFLGVHFEPILALIAVVERFWPHPAALLIFAAAGLAAAGPAAYLMIGALLPERPGVRWLAAALGVPLPCWVAIQEAAGDQFHPENLALALALFAGWAALRGHRKLMWGCALLVLCCKEDQVYTVGTLGLLAISRGAPQLKADGRRLIALAVGWLVIVTGIVQQIIRSGGYSDFVYYRWLLHPTALGILQELTRPEALRILAVALASLFFLPLLAPRWLLLVIPPYLADVLSGHIPENDLHLHYVLILMFPLIVAGGIGGARLLSRSDLRGPVLLAAAVPGLLLGYGLGRLPPDLGSEARFYGRPDAVAQLMEAKRAVPARAPVEADDCLAVWFADRQVINDFPDKLDASRYVVIDRQDCPTGHISQQKRAAALAQLASDGRQQRYDDGRFEVWSPVPP
jgi:uncharacterized membrane protein